jgi:ABC-2 type transport system permease protein
MRIIFDITLQELKLICRDKTFHVLASILIILTGYTLVVSNNGYQSAHSQHQHLTDTVRHLFENQKSGSAHMAGHYGHIVFKPATYLQAIEPGVTPFTGTTVRLEAHKQNEAVFSPASGQSSLVRFGEFSFALLLQLVFPLMILFTCYRLFVKKLFPSNLKIHQAEW